MPRPEKVAAVEEIKADLAESQAVFVTDYRGLTVSDLGALRAKLRDVGTDYKVVKNTLATIAADASDIEEFTSLLVGPTAIAYAKDDAAATAKALDEFARESRILKIRGALLEGSVIDEAQVKALADLPSREVLLSKVVGGMQAPISGFVNVLQGTLRKFVYALDAVREQKENASA